LPAMGTSDIACLVSKTWRTCAVATRSFYAEMWSA